METGAFNHMILCTCIIIIIVKVSMILFLCVVHSTCTCTYSFSIDPGLHVCINLESVLYIIYMKMYETVFGKTNQMLSWHFFRETIDGKRLGPS